MRAPRPRVRCDAIPNHRDVAAREVRFCIPENDGARRVPWIQTRDGRHVPANFDELPAASNRVDNGPRGLDEMDNAYHRNPVRADKAIDALQFLAEFLAGVMLEVARQRVEEHDMVASRDEMREPIVTVLDFEQVLTNRYHVAVGVLFNRAHERRAFFILFGDAK